MSPFTPLPPGRTLDAELAEVRAEQRRLFADLAANQHHFRKLARSVLAVQEQERRRLARELHDGVGQNLTVQQHELESLAGALRHHDPELAARCTRALEMCRTMLNDTRQLSRLLRPQILDDLGLAPALRWLMRSLSQPGGFEPELHIDAKLPPLGDDLDTTLFRVAQEALNNVVRHAHAKHVVLRLASRDGQVQMMLMDDGIDDADGADIVIDAMGRRTPTSRWFPDGAEPATSDCSVVYLCRYYRQRDGFELPDGPWLVSPRGDIGYLGYATFPGDNATFAALLAISSGVAEWRGLAHEDRFERAIQTIPMLRQWVDPDGVEPITPVMPMAGLRNTFRSVDEAAPFVPVGDALAHTDPTLAHGLSFALIHAREVRNAMRDHGDRRDVLAAFLAAVVPEARERYELATALDEQRRRLWLGEEVDAFRHDGGAYELFSIAGAGAAALADDRVLRASVRRSGLLERTATMDENEALLRRIDEVLVQLRSTPRPPAGPSREEMAAIAAGTS